MFKMVFRNPNSPPCCGGFNLFRNAVIILNILYIAVGVALIALAASGKASAYIADFTLFGGIIACGVLLVAIATVGIAGTILHHQVTLFFYMMLLVMLFVVQISVACACLAMSSSQQQGLFDLAWNSSSQSTRNKMQQDYDCCAAVHNSAQNDTEHFLGDGNTTGVCAVDNITLPCCRGSTAHCCTGEVGPGSEGVCPCMSCWQKVGPLIDHFLKAAGAVGLVFSFSEILGVYLTFRYRNQKNPYANPNDFL